MRDANTQLLANRALDLFVRKRLDLILQARERIEIRRRQQVGSRRQNLSKLDECWPERFEVARERFGGRWICRRCVFPVQRPGDKFSAAVLGCEPGDVLVTPEATSHRTRLSNVRADVIAKREIVE